MNYDFIKLKFRQSCQKKEKLLLLQKKAVSNLIDFVLKN